MLIQFAFAAFSTGDFGIKFRDFQITRALFIRLRCVCTTMGHQLLNDSPYSFSSDGGYFLFRVIQSRKAVTRVKTSGAPLAQGTPHETTPHTWPDALSTRGPPESPLQAPSSFPFNVQMFLLKLTGGVTSKKWRRMHSGLEMDFRSARFSSLDTFPGN